VEIVIAFSGWGAGRCDDGLEQRRRLYFARLQEELVDEDAAEAYLGKSLGDWTSRAVDLCWGGTLTCQTNGRFL